MLMRTGKWVLVGFMLIGSAGCLFTKVVTVPMRVVGAVASIIPVAGDAAHEAVDGAAATVDKLPF